MHKCLYFVSQLLISKIFILRLTSGTEHSFIWDSCASWSFKFIAAVNDGTSGGRFIVRLGCVSSSFYL